MEVQDKTLFLDLVVGESAGDKFLCTNYLVEKQREHAAFLNVFPK